MARRQNPVDQGNPQLAEFASELRELRKRAQLTMRQLAAKANYSHSRIHEAEAGRKLPPWQLVTVYLRECGLDEDADRWQRWWKKLEQEITATRRAGAAPGRAAATAATPRQAGPPRGTPAAADSPQRFLDDIRALYTQRKIGLRAVAAQAGCSVSTVSTTLRAGTLPRWERTEQFLRAAGITEPALSAWHQRWQQLRTVPAPEPATASFDEPSPTLSGATATTSSATGELGRSAPSDSVKLRLAREVFRRYQQQLLSLQIHSPLPLPVRWTTAERLSDHWPGVRRASLGAQLGPLRLDGVFDSLAEIYRQIPSRRLVILGAAGSGKSVLAMQLAADLAADIAQGDVNAALVPVICSFGGWDPRVVKLEDWLADQIRQDYRPLSSSGARQQRQKVLLLLAQGQILPIFDGFDEMPVEQRLPVLRALNRSGLPMVLISRTEGYADVRQQGMGIAGAAAIELNDLLIDEVIDYLRLTTPPRSDGSTVWDPVLSVLRAHPDSPLAQALRTPLMVSLARQIYSNAGADPVKLLSFPTVREVAEHLMDAFLSGALPAESKKTRTWLSHLAQQPDINIERLPAAVSPTVSAVLGGLVAATAAAAAGAITALWTDTTGMPATAYLGLAFFAVVALTVSAYRRSHHYQLGGLWKSLVLWVAGFLGLPLAAGLCFTVGYHWPVGIAAGAAVAVASLLVRHRVLMHRPMSLGPHGMSLTPRGILRAQRHEAVLAAVIMTFPPLSIIVAISTGVVQIQSTSSPVVLAGSVTGIFTWALALSRWGQWQLIVRWWLPTRGQLPFRLLSFLHTAHQRGVLSRVGPVYQFRHATLQQLLSTRSRRYDDSLRAAPRALLRITSQVSAAGGCLYLAAVGLHTLVTMQNADNNTMQNADTNTLLTTALNLFSAFFVITFAVMAMIALLRYVTANGDSSATASAMSTLVYAVIGLVIGGLAQVLVHFVLPSVS